MYGMKEVITMATASIKDSTFVLSFDGGFDENDEPIVLTKSFQNIKAGADYDALLAIAQKFVPLQQHPLLTVERDDTNVINA